MSDETNEGTENTTFCGAVDCPGHFHEAETEEKEGTFETPATEATPEATAAPKPRGMLIRGAVLGELAKLTTADDSRLAMNAVAVTKDYVEATNGHYLIRISGPSEPPSPDDYPMKEDLPEAAPPGEEPVLLPTEAAKAFAGAIRRGYKAGRTIPIFAYGLLGVQIDGQLLLACTDLESWHVQSARQLEGSWPTTANVIPQETPERVRVTLSAEYLEKIAGLVKRIGRSRGPSVTVSIGRPEEAVTFHAKTEEGETILAVLMPMRA